VVTNLLENLIGGYQPLEGTCYLHLHFYPEDRSSCISLNGNLVPTKMPCVSLEEHYRNLHRVENLKSHVWCERLVQDNSTKTYIYNGNMTSGRGAALWILWMPMSNSKYNVPVC
jgi:hypothetical protein